MPTSLLALLCHDFADTLRNFLANTHIRNLRYQPLSICQL
jgi:hypothetical protein